jgi:hypothetical protein
MDNEPRLAKAHRKEVADQYLGLGWTLVSQFTDGDNDEPYEYLFRWDHDADPKYVTVPAGFLCDAKE